MDDMAVLYQHRDSFEEDTTMRFFVAYIGGGAICADFNTREAADALKTSFPLILEVLPARDVRGFRS